MEHSEKQRLEPGIKKFLNNHHHADKISPSPTEATEHAVSPQVPTQRGETETDEADLQEAQEVGGPGVCAVQGCPYQ